MDVIEIMARAIYESEWVGEYPTAGVEHALAIQKANAAVESLAEAGYAVVPVEPTLGMERDGGQEYAMTFQRPMMAEVNAKAIYRAMIEAGRVK